MQKNSAVSESYVHPTAVVEEHVQVGEGVKIWHFCHVRSHVTLGSFVSLGRDVFVDEGVEIQAHARVQNGVSVYRGVAIAPWVFVGPHVIFTNDRWPRAGKREWQVIPTFLDVGCSVGAGAIIRCGVRVGAFSMIGAGSVVTRDVAPFTLVLGSPARARNRICACGETQTSLREPLLSPFCQRCPKVMPDVTLALAESEFKRLAADGEVNAA